MGKISCRKNHRIRNKKFKIAIAQSYIGNTEINSSLDLLNFYDQNIKSYLALNINDFYQYLEREAPNAKIPCSFFAQMQNMKEIIDNKNHELWAGMLFDIKGIGLTIFSVFSKDFSIVQDLDLGLGYNSHFNFFDKIKKELIKNNVNFVEFVEDLTLNHLYRRYSLSDLIKFYNGKLKRTSEKYKTYIDTEDEELSREELENIRYFRRILEKWNAFRIINVFDNIFRSKDQSITWELPDGFLIKLNSSERISENIEFFTEEIDLPEINITLTNHLNDRNHFSQVLMESLEGFVIRELLRRTSIDVDKYHKINSIISNRANFSCATDESYKIMSDLLSLAEKTNFYSWRIFWEITESNVNLVPEDILRKFLASFPRKTYKIRKLAHYISVSPNNIGDLKSQYVDILIELSESKLLNYIISSITGEEFLEASVFKKKFPY